MIAQAHIRYLVLSYEELREQFIASTSSKSSHPDHVCVCRAGAVIINA